MDIKVKVNAVDVTNYVRIDSIEVDGAEGQRVNTCSLIIDDITALVSTLELKEIIITDSGETVRYFAGLIANVTNVIDGISIVHHCECQDYTMLAETAIVNELYTDQTDKEIIDDMFTDELSEISTAGITETGIPATSMSFNHKSLRASLDAIAKITGMEWYVDYNKLLHYYAPEEDYASFDLSDDPDNSATYPYYDFDYSKDATGIVNRVMVVGAWYKSSDITTTFAGDGVQELFKLPYTRINAPAANPTLIQVWRNTGIEGTPVWTAQTVGLANTEDAAGFNCMFNFGEATLEWAVAPSKFYDAWKMTYRYAVPIATTVRNQDSYDAYGRWYDKKIVDKNIRSFEEAEAMGRRVLKEQAWAKQIIKLKHNKAGSSVGQQQKVTHSILGIDEYFTISKLRMVFRRASTAEYIVTLAGSHPNADIIDNLVELNRLVNFHEINADEQIFHLFDLEESLALTDVVAEGHATTQGYVWGVSGATDLDWSFGTWESGGAASSEKPSVSAGDDVLAVDHNNMAAYIDEWTMMMGIL